MLLVALLLLGGSMQTPEHTRLQQLVGDWDLELTFYFEPGKPTKARGHSQITSLYGLFIEEKIEGLIGEMPFGSTSITGYNADSKVYEATRVASTNTIRIAESGTFKDGALVLEAKYPFMGETWTQRTVIKQTGDDAMHIDVFMGHGKAPEWKGCEISYKRRKT
jgi:hypothetical protein